MKILKSINRPFTDLGKFVLNSVLLLIPIVSFSVLGYILDCAQFASKGDFNLPPWNNFWRKLWDGILATIILLIYIVVFMIPYTVLFYLDLDISTLGGLIVIVAILLGIYLLPSAILRFAVERKFISAFSPKVFQQAFTKAYLIAFLICIIFSIIFNIIIINISSLINLLPIPYEVFTLLSLSLFVVFMYVNQVIVFSVLG